MKKIRVPAACDTSTDSALVWQALKTFELAIETVLREVLLAKPEHYKKGFSPAEVVSATLGMSADEFERSMETCRMRQSEIVFVTNLQGQASKPEKNTLTEEQLKTQVALVKACDLGMNHCTVPKGGEEECKHMTPSIAYTYFERIKVEVIIKVDESAERIGSKGGVWGKKVTFTIPTHYDISNRLDLAQLRGGTWHEIMELGFLRYFGWRYGRRYEWYGVNWGENDVHQDVEDAQKGYFYRGAFTGKKWGWPDLWDEWKPEDYMLPRKQ